MAIEKISEEIKSAQDYLFDGVTVPANTTTTGDANLVGGAQAALEIVVVAKTALAVADTKTISVKLTGSETENGSFADVVTMYSLTAAGGNGAITAGTELARYVYKPSDPLWAKAVVTTDDATATGSINAYVRYISR